MPAFGRRSALVLSIAALYAPVTHAASFVWTTGAFSAQGIPSPLPAADTLTLDSFASKTFDAGFTNDGTVFWLGGTVLVNDASVTNAGIFNTSFDGTIQRNAGSSGLFTNSGLFNKDGGTGATTFGVNLTLVNSGVLNAATGRIDYLAASQTFQAGTQFTGAGNHRIAASATFNGAFTSNERVSLELGTFTGANSSFAGTLGWSSGTLTGTWTNANGSTLAIQGAPVKSLSSATLLNQGLVTITGGNLTINDSTFTNAGTFDFRSDLTLSRSTGSSGTFTNDGLVRKSGGNAASSFGVNLTLVNNGSFEAQTGRIDFSAASQTFNAGTQFTGAGSFRLLASATFNGQFASNDRVEFTANNTITGNAAGFTGKVQFSNGTLAGTWTVPSGSTLSMDSLSSKALGSATVANSGLVTLGGGNLFINDSTFTNAGTFELLTDVSVARTTGSSGTFQNTGTVIKSGGAGAATFGNNLTLTNSGVFVVQSGRIDFGAPSQTFNAGTAFEGAGSFRVTSSATFNGAFTSNDRVELAGFGSYSGSAASFAGQVTYSSGTLTGGWSIPAASTLAMRSTSVKTFSSANVQNAGLVTHDTGSVFLNDSTFTNDGTYQFLTDATIARSSGSAGTFTNNGTVRKSGGTGASTFGSNVTLVNTGTFDVQTGRIDFSASSQTFNQGTKFTGAGSHRVLTAATFNGSFASNDRVELAGPVTYTGGNASFSGKVGMTNGTLSGTWTIPVASTLELRDTGLKFLSSATLTNDGLVTLQGADLIINDSTLTNGGRFDLLGDISVRRAAGSAGTFDNAGTVRKTGGTGASTFGVNLTLIGRGVFEAQTGRIDYGAASQTFNAGSQFTGAGHHRLTTGATFNGHFVSNDRVELTAGGGTYAGTNAGFTGRVDWSAGQMTGTWNLPGTATLAVQGAGGKTLASATLASAGLIRFDAGILVINDSTLTNQGTFDVTGDLLITRTAGSAGSLVNQGLFRKTAGAGTATIGTLVGFSNASGGTVQVDAGTLQASTFTANQGTIATATGATFAPAASFTNTGLLKGTGTIAAANVINSGRVAPGASPGTLNVAGSFQQSAAGTLEIEIAGTASFDVLSVTGSASLAGTIAVHRFGGYVPVIGDTFVILTSTGALSGSFSGEPVLVGFGAGIDFDVLYDYGLRTVSLQVAAVPEPETWALMIAGLGLVGWMARRRRVSPVTSAA